MTKTSDVTFIGVGINQALKINKKEATSKLNLLEMRVKL
jgi:hypothetical protein